MTLAAGAESSKVDYKPLHHAGNCNEYRANTISVCTGCCFSNALAPMSVIRHYISVHVHGVGLVNQDEPECMKNGQQVTLGDSNPLLAKRTDKCKRRIDSSQLLPRLLD
jgi:hypothetical protein